MNHEVRLQKFQQRLEEEELDGFLITHPPNLNYLFGFTGSSAIAALTGGDCIFIVDSRYVQQARDEVRSATVVLSEGSLEACLRHQLLRVSNHTLGFEASHVSCDTFQLLQSLSPGQTLVPCKGILESLRSIKEPSELRLMESAFERAHEALGKTLDRVEAGLTESEVAGILEYEMRRVGGEGTAFDTIVASGPRSALPHGTASDKRIEPGELVLIDFGIRYRSYCSDLTRVILPPKAPSPTILRVVRQAQRAALEAIRPGIEACRVDAAARQVVSENGFGDYFQHGTGHGIGLEVHESPKLSAGSDDILHEGMVLTVEPGIYLPGDQGVRVEDVVVVTEGGYRFLSDPSR